MIVSVKYRFAYMPLSKTGSTALTKFLTEEYDGVLWEDYCPEIQKTWAQGHGRRHVTHLPEQFKDFFVFATIRNPFHLEISRYYEWLWIWQGKYNVDFPYFIHNLMATGKPLSQFVALHQEAEYVPPVGCVAYQLDAVLKQESLEADLLKLPFLKDLPKLTQENVSRNKVRGVPEPYYTPELAQEVIRLRDLDFDKFGYDRLSYPGPTLINA